MSDTIQIVQLVVAMLAASIFVAMVARRISIPESVLLVLVGLAGAAAFPALRFAITPDLVLSVLIPGLVFEAAYALDWTELRRMFGALTGLAIVGVVISALAVTIALHLAIGLPLELAFVVGAITAATDPVAVVATLARLRVPPSLRTLVEGESLLNDGTGLVLFALAVRAVEGNVTIGDGALLFVTTLAISVLVGLLGGTLAAIAVRVTNEPPVQLVISIVLAYGSFQLANATGLSGIIATVIAAMVLGSAMRRDGARAKAHHDFDTFWGTAAFVLSACAFLLIGFAIDLGEISGVLAAVGWGAAAVLIGRVVMVYLPAGILRVVHRPLPRGWTHVLFWSGLRGAIAVAAALSLPPSFPHRALIQEISFGIVLVTLVLQGTSAPFLIRAALAPSPPR